ncbi:MAG: hypothetical protein EOL87_18225 [Spartobacteria bacterium]|nr:hypothetical protein [Spartobacteria bacterium]
MTTPQHPLAPALLAGVKSEPHMLYVFDETGKIVEKHKINYNPWLREGNSLVKYLRAVVVSLFTSNGDIIARRGFSSNEEARRALRLANVL